MMRNDQLINCNFYFLKPIAARGLTYKVFFYQMNILLNFIELFNVVRRLTVDDDREENNDNLEYKSLSLLLYEVCNKLWAQQEASSVKNNQMSRTERISRMV